VANACDFSVFLACYFFDLHITYPIVICDKINDVCLLLIVVNPPIGVLAIINTLIGVCQGLFFMEFCDRLKAIRITEDYNQKDFADSIGCGYSTLGHYEAGRRDPTQKVISALCMKFPEYTLWIMTGQTQPPQQISPDMAKANATSDNVVAGVLNQ
jgi:DNA-binding XRE family transcriptional regulator